MECLVLDLRLPSQISTVRIDATTSVRVVLIPELLLLLFFSCCVHQSVPSETDRQHVGRFLAVCAHYIYYQSPVWLDRRR